MQNTDQKYWVYILKSEKDNRFYIGSSSDVDARLRFHNAGLQRSTKYRIPFKLIYSELLPNKAEALKREKQIKSWKGGKAFHKLIEGVLSRRGGIRRSGSRRGGTGSNPVTPTNFLKEVVFY